MKKTALAFLTILMVSCSASKSDSSKKPLYEILTQQNNGGASIRFFEILTEANEIKMLQGDENLKNKVKPGDTTNSNFVILNLGEKSSGGHLIGIEKVEETADKIIITVKETRPKEGEMTTSVMSNPYTVVKINSKKEIVIQ